MDLVSIKRRKKSSETIDSSHNNGKSSVRHKNLICIICGAPATGFNFGVITCMCCKAFFRRNALFGLPSLQCRYSTENCSIDIKSRRDCSYCRLKKCFELGMKKELILTEELKRLKREKILANRQMTLTTIRPTNLLLRKQDVQLSDNDLSYLVNIYNIYEEYCHSPLIIFEKNEYETLAHQPIKGRIKIQHYFHYYTRCESFLIQFFQYLPELKQFSNDELLLLTKHNMRFIMRISLIETLSDQLPLWPAINLLLQTMFGNLIEKTSQVLHEFKDQINDSTCIRLVVIILLFSTYPTYIGHLDTLCLYKIQVKYIELLWLYLKQRYSEMKACQNFSIIVRHCLHIQTIGHLADLKRHEILKQNVLLE